MTTEATIWVRFTQEGFHRWPDAAKILPERAYLSSKHRHLFHVTIEVPVTHSDRDIEFHDLMAYAKTYWPADGQMGSKSCERMAEEIGYYVSQKFDVNELVVTVSEDDECGARVRITNV